MYKVPDAPVCERENDLMAFLYGEIDESAASDFQLHLANCSECESQLAAFKEIRASVGAWRQESLAGATASFASSRAMYESSKSDTRSAKAAIREFFDLSPLWMKASIAFASVLFCLVSILALAYLFENRQPVVAGNEKVYTEEQLQTRISDAVKAEQDREAQKRSLQPSVAVNNNQEVRPQKAVGDRPNTRPAKPKVERRPLTRSEREQLAADLRLIVPQDDTDLDLLSDGNNQ